VADKGYYFEISNCYLAQVLLASASGSRPGGKLIIIYNIFTQMNVIKNMKLEALFDLGKKFCSA